MNDILKTGIPWALDREPKSLIVCNKQTQSVKLT